MKTYTELQHSRANGSQWILKVYRHPLYTDEYYYRTFKTRKDALEYKKQLTQEKINEEYKLLTK